MLKKLSNWWRWIIHPLPQELRNFHQTVVIAGIEYELSPARLDEATEIMEVERDAYFGKEPWPIELFWSEINRQQGRLYIVLRARETKTIVAYIGTAFRPGLREVHVTNIAVKRQWQHRGIGKFLILYVMSVAAQIKFKTVTLETRQSNAIARKLYQTLGFKQVRTKRRYYDDHEDAIEMMASLGGAR